ncbi:MAG TPA: flagellar hook protein FlgE [Burkholderiaceae bacterium]|jgi:flagellar hook protein FlgE|nr:flagellar hook protein FlgE [Burkholderiaceae bacterium]
MSFEQALSGLNAASQNLDAIGNNIANASTIGFKDGRAEFADVFAASLASSGTQIGIGTRLTAVSPQFTQGNITTTGNPMDVAINGQGFFRMASSGAVSYSRDGEFQLDKNGFIVNSTGAQLTGYPANANGTISPGTPLPLQLSLANIAPKATATASLSLNLDSRSTTPTAAFNINDPTSYNSSTALTVYDSQGNSHTLSMYFRTTAANTWSVYAAADGSILNTGNPIGTLSFNSSGAMSADVTMNPSIPLTNGAATPLTFALLFPAASTSQYGASFAVSSNSQNGYTTGQLSGFSIGSDGIVQGRYSNGQTRDQGQIALANFINPQGLVALGGNQWAESSASGQPLIGTPSTGSNGALQSSALESSNVDVTSELVNMITAQRVYQANAETIKTEDQVQQTLMNLR